MGPIPLQHREEHFSKAFVKAVAAKCGYKYDEVEDYGVDVQLAIIAQRPSGRTYDTGKNLQIQLKSSSKAIFEDQSIAYDLEAKNYNDLVERDRGCPLILVLYCFPETESDWLVVSEEKTEMKRCAYWISLYGEPKTDNDSTKRIRIPKANLFDATALCALMDKVRVGERL